METIIVFLGGSIGAALRYLIYLLASNYGMSFSGTFAVNIIGSFLLGFLSTLEIENNLTINKHFKLFLTTGIISSFTTFSTFSYEILNMIEKGQIQLGLIYLSLSLFLGLVSVFAGFYLANLITRTKAEESEEVCMD